MTPYLAQAEDASVGLPSAQATAALWRELLDGVRGHGRICQLLGPGGRVHMAEVRTNPRRFRMCCEPMGRGTCCCMPQFSLICPISNSEESEPRPKIRWQKRAPSDSASRSERH